MWKVRLCLPQLRPSPGAEQEVRRSHLTGQEGENGAVALFTLQTVNTLNVLLSDLPYGQCGNLSFTHTHTLQVCGTSPTADSAAVTLALPALHLIRAFPCFQRAATTARPKSSRIPSRRPQQSPSQSFFWNRRTPSS